MIILFWSIAVILLVASAVIAIMSVLNNPRLGEAVQAFLDELRNSSTAASFRRHQVELWKWEAHHDDNTCEDCLERASWPPMDIADWMKEGMPRTPEADTKCGDNCRCQLVRYRPGVFSEKYHKDH